MLRSKNFNLSWFFNQRRERKSIFTCKLWIQQKVLIPHSFLEVNTQAHVPDSLSYLLLITSKLNKGKEKERQIIFNNMLIRLQKHPKAWAFLGL